MCQNSTDSQKSLSGAWAKVQGHATAQLQLSNQSPVMCQLGLSVMKTPFATNDNTTLNAATPSTQGLELGRGRAKTTTPCVGGKAGCRCFFRLRPHSRLTSTRCIDFLSPGVAVAAEPDTPMLC